MPWTVGQKIISGVPRDLKNLSGVPRDLKGFSSIKMIEKVCSNSLLQLPYNVHSNVTATLKHTGSKQQTM